jgi:hypothetical protein
MQSARTLLTLGDKEYGNAIVRKVPEAVLKAYSAVVRAKFEYEYSGMCSRQLPHVDFSQRLRLSVNGRKMRCEVPS